jgi:hypothetical protein
MRDERWRRLLWFVGLWLAGVAVLAIVAGLLRLAMSAVGY